MIRVLRLLGVAALFAIAAIATMMLWLWMSPGDDVHAPRGYPLIAKLFLKHNWLRLDDQTGSVTLAANASTAAQSIYRGTFLADDVEDFNQGTRTIFKVENEQLAELDSKGHNIVLPF